MRSRSALLALVLAVQGPKHPTPPTAPPDLAHDLGVGVSEVQPLAVAPADLARVAGEIGCSAEELAGARFFRGNTLGPKGVATPATLIELPLAGAARGGRVALSVIDGRAHEFGLWGALDFEADPTSRWATFGEQLRVAGTNETGETVGPLASVSKTPRELAQKAKSLAQGKSADERLAYALFLQRQMMRRNGQWLSITRHTTKADPAWPLELAREMRALAAVSPDLAPLLGAEGAERHAKTARELADVFEDWHEELAGDPEGDAKELQQRMHASCAACHKASTPQGKKWDETCFERRNALGLSATQLCVGYDLARAIGDDGAVSQEIASKVKAGILLAGAAH